MTNGTSIALKYSNATTVPAVTSVALLGGYTSVAAFNTSERARVSCSAVQQPVVAVQTLHVKLLFDDILLQSRLDADCSRH